MRYIRRDMESKISSLSEEYACLLITGARQVGKTTVLKQLMDANRHYVTLDDLEARRLAQEDPAFFLQLYPPPVFIDEVQYAPELFSYIKIAIDQGVAPGSFWLTGSQAFRLMTLSQESLAGRMAILHMPPLSQHEIWGSGDNSPFKLELPALKEREANWAPADVDGMYRRIWQGGMPGFISGRYSDRETFYSSYVQTYIQRDIKDFISFNDPMVFADFVRAAACRVGQVLNLHAIAQDVGVSDDTARRWLQALEQSDVIFFLRPYANNLLKRSIKTPKLYFWDCGLVAYLTRYEDPASLSSGAVSGAILENYAVCELMKSYRNAGRDCLLWYYRDRDSREIDLVLETNGQLHPMEIKRSVNPGAGLTSTFGLLDKAALPRGTGAVLCLRQTLSAIDRQHYIVPIWMI